ncbi:Uncharacterised protein [Escherichia coli]|uniref:Uncharacterized protein n=1 Tax=Escherichia coli TaxID=562 RepID=A0A376LKI2_ECOLX|nr:Uncharacterised protein [Escherichia coli]
MTRQTNDANIMSEIFTPKLRTNTKLLTGLEQYFFQLNITECLSLLVSAGGQIVVIFSLRPAWQLLRFDRLKALRRQRRCGKAGRQRCPAIFIFSIKNAVSFSGCNRIWFPDKARLYWQEPPPLLIQRKWYSSPATALISICAGRLVCVLTSVNISSGAFCEKRRLFFLKSGVNAFA